MSKKYASNLFIRSMLIVCALLAVETAHAQQASITGRVTDQIEAVVPGAEVTVTSAATNFSTSVTTDDEGVFTIPQLQPGVYDVRVTAAGFGTLIQKGITLNVQQVASYDFALQTGAVSGVVEITAGAQLTEPETSTLGQVIDNKRIVDLPLNGRNPLELSRLAPGVNLQASTFLDVRGFNLTSISINGGQGGTNAVLLDGGSATLPERNEYSVAPNVDTVQEFRVQTNASSAEFGLTGGGVINLVTRSGTNDFRAGLFEFVRNDVLDANNYNNNRVGRDKPALRYNQFGGFVGGPVYLPRFGEGGPAFLSGKDRLFFFFNYEGFRYREPRIQFARVPTALERQGDFSQTYIIDSVTRQPRLVQLFDPATTRNNPSGSGQVRTPFASSVLPRGRLSPIALQALSYIPLPNRTPDNITGANNYVASPGFFVDNDQYNARVDYNLNDKNRLFGRYSQNTSVNTGNPATYGFDNIADPTGSQQVRRNKQITIGNTTFFNSEIVNELRVSFSRQFLVGEVAGLGQNAASVLGLPSLIPNAVFPRFNIGDVSPIGNPIDQFVRRGLTVGQITNTLRIVKGKHTFAVGADLRNNLRNNFQPSSSGASGQFTFARNLTGNPQDASGNAGFGLATFLLGAVSGGNFDSPVARADSFRYFAPYVNDDYKVTRRLTLNLGLRYDLITPSTERFDRYSNFDPTEINPVTGRPGVLEFSEQFGRSPIELDKNNFGPRVGFAFDVFGDARTVVRGGYGIFYYHSASLEFPNVQGFSSSTPFLATQTNFPAFDLGVGPAQFNQPVGSALGARSFLGNAVTFVEPNSKTPNTQQFNLGIQRQLPGNILIDLAYAGSKGTNIIGFGYDLNQLDPQFLSLGTALDTQVPNPFFGIITSGALSGRTISRRQSLLRYPGFLSVQVDNPRLGSTSYHSGQAKLEKRFSRGLSFLASYTYSKLIGDVGRNIIDFGTAGGPQQIAVGCGQNAAYDRRPCRSIEPQDLTHNFVGSFVTDVPIGKGRRFLSDGGVLAAILGGFQLNGIVALRSGLPLVIRGANNGAADRPNITGSARLSNDERSPDRWFDTSVFVAPPQFTFGNVPRTLPDARGPGFASFDLSLFRNINFTERFYVQLRAETFNIFNRTNFNQPNTNFLSGDFGRITSAGEPRRVQLGLKLYF